MTWSIIARDNATGQFGIAVATRFFAVGARVPHIAAGLGGIATQALVNPYYGIDGLKLLREGRQPRDIVETLIAADAGRESRQLHIMDASGRIAAHTGRDCVDWCGHIEGNGFSIAGNMLAGAARARRHRESLHRRTKALPFAQRLIAAMRSGEAAGGDKRGRQSAALLIYGEEEWSDARPARRRPRRSACRTRTSRSGQPRALGAFPKIPAHAARIRPALPIARPSTPGSKRRLRVEK